MRTGGPPVCPLLPVPLGTAAMTAPATVDLLRHLATRPGHDEVKADFRDLLVREFGVDLGSLDFERCVPEVRGRIDALIGRTVFEAKRNLDDEMPDVLRRMPDYLADREREEGQPFVGIASDGRKWLVFELVGGALVQAKSTTLDADKADQFLAWLDGVVALRAALPPDPLTIRAELGHDSIAYRRVDRELRALWAELADDPAQALKRQLWADMLKLVYGREVEGDALWFQHTYLVVVAKCDRFPRQARQSNLKRRTRSTLSRCPHLRHRQANAHRPRLHRRGHGSAGSRSGSTAPLASSARDAGQPLRHGRR